MGEYMFGVFTSAKRHLTREQCDRRDRICIEEGGTGFTYIREPTHQWKGWFTGPNLGEPFDRSLRDRVMARVEREGT